MNNQHLYLRSSNNIDHINLLLIGFAKPKLFSPRVKNPYNRNLIFKSFT